MNAKQLKTCFKKIQLEKDDRNITELFVDTEICSIKCDDIRIYTAENGVKYEDLLMLLNDKNETISIIEIKNITNIRFTDTNHETFKLI